MALLNSIASWYMTKRIHQIDLFRKYPHEVQQEWFQKLIESGRETEFGKKYGFNEITNAEQFRRQIPLQNYDSLKPYIERLRKGEQFLLWPTDVKWFAKSAGTTNDKSKFIPITEESLKGCHYKGGKDMITFYCNNYPDHHLFTGKNLALGGSHQTEVYDFNESYTGDVSAIIIQNLPLIADYFRSPSVDIALIGEWEEKLEKVASSTIDENVVSLAGVPSWMLVLLKKVLNDTGKKSIKEIWPNLEVYFHGGVSYSPYRNQVNELLGFDIHLLELFNASEGFFGMQDQRDSNELLLLLDYGIYYEFLPEEEWNNENGKTLTLDEVVLGHNYALVISTTGGLWRYNVGDTIEFTNLLPYRFKITGRTKHFINAFGEELMIGNAEKALEIACEKTGAEINEYTAAPIYMNKENKQGAHEWLIEFKKTPADLIYFSELLDNALKTINSDYEAKRYHNLALQFPIIRSLPQGTFYNWLKSKNKLGGQHKIPRLANERKFVEEILALKKW
ncbi:MAG: GH3 auxin-responsive promoter family protein [Bacteroidetes bacterium]|nr:GH3 auxin-responsive promoter family protein [Bacteroidota bacterium]